MQARLPALLMRRRRCKRRARRQRPWIRVSAPQTLGSGLQTPDGQPPQHRSTLLFQASLGLAGTICHALDTKYSAAAQARALCILCILLAHLPAVVRLSLQGIEAWAPWQLSVFVSEPDRALEGLVSHA